MSGASSKEWHLDKIPATYQQEQELDPFRFMDLKQWSPVRHCFWVNGICDKNRDLRFTLSFLKTLSAAETLVFSTEAG